MSWLALVDCDGPLIDVSARYARIHSELAAEFSGRPLPLPEYWRLKRARVSEVEIFTRTGLTIDDAEAASAERLRRIETERYLHHDRAWDFAETVLRQLRDAGLVQRAVLVTQRVSRQRTLDLLQRVGLARLLDGVVVGRGDNTLTAKVGTLRAASVNVSQPAVFVGDTEVDIASGQALGARTVAVLSGIRSRELLEACGPDVIMDDIRELPQWLESQTPP